MKSHHTPRRHIADAERFLMLAQKAVRTARQKGARGDAHLARVEEGTVQLRRVVQAVERGQ